MNAAAAVRITPSSRSRTLMAFFMASVAPLLIWLSASAGGDRVVQVNALCAKLLAPDVSAEREPGTVESAIAAAWADLLTKDRALTEAETVWLGALSGGVEFFSPDARLFDGAIREALMDLERIATEGVVEIDSEALGRAILGEAARILDASEKGDSIALESRAERSKKNLTNPVVSEGTLGGVAIGSPLALGDGSVVVVTHIGEVLFYDPAGRLRATYATGAPMENGPTLLRHGRIALVTLEGDLILLDQNGRELWRKGLALRDDQVKTSVVELRDGRLVLAGYQGRVYWMSGAGDILHVEKAQNTIYADPLPLDNGNLLVRDSDDRVYLFNSEGAPIRKWHQFPGFNRGSPRPLKLANGDFAMTEDAWAEVSVHHPDGTRVWIRPMLTGNRGARAVPYLELPSTGVRRDGDPSLVVYTSTGKLLVLDAQGFVVREFTTNAPRLMPHPVFRNGSFVFADYNGWIYRLSSDGSRLERAYATVAPDSGIAFLGNGTLLAAGRFRLWTIDLERLLDAK